MRIKIRKANPKDWKIIQKLNNEVFEDNSQYDKYLNLKWPFSKKAIKYYQKVVSDDKYFCSIAEVNNKPVGYLVGLEKNYDYRINRVGEIENMGTTPEYRSKGIGTKLVKEFKKWCKQKGIIQIYANTYFKSSRAIKFYKKQGMKPIDIGLMGNAS